MKFDLVDIMLDGYIGDIPVPVCRQHERVPGDVVQDPPVHQSRRGVHHHRLRDHRRLRHHHPVNHHGRFARHLDADDGVPPRRIGRRGEAHVPAGVLHPRRRDHEVAGRINAEEVVFEEGETVALPVDGGGGVALRGQALEAQLLALGHLQAPGNWTELTL